MTAPRHRDAERQIEEIVNAARATGIEPEVPFARLVGIVVTSLRNRAGYSQEKLCAETKISQSTLSRIENGETPLDAVQAFKISRAINIAPSYIFDAAGELESVLSSKNTKITDDIVPRKSDDHGAMGKMGAAALGPILGAALLGPVGLIAGAITSAVVLFGDRKKK